MEGKEENIKSGKKKRERAMEEEEVEGRRDRRMARVKEIGMGMGKRGKKNGKGRKKESREEGK